MTLDVGRMGQAIGGPGVDTREWVSKAVVITEPVVDAKAGYVVRVKLLPSRIDVTASIDTGYAGGGFGLHQPLVKDDLVIVVNPGGLPDAGYHVVSRFWQRSDPPPQDVVDHPQDVILVTAPGKSTRVIVTGAGSVVIEARGSGRVEVSAPQSRIDLTAPEVRVGAAPVQKMLLAETYRQAEATLQAAQITWLAALAVYIIIPVPTGLETSTYQSAQAAYVTALNAFQAAAATYLAVHGRVS